ncbi:MAG: MFS transporter [Chloroflexi bacterium]|nr:MFS transporter [Chloroflexota bacterium]
MSASMPEVSNDSIERTSLRGWVVLMLCQLQLSSLRLSSFVLGVLLPFIAQDLALSPVQVGLLQGVWWVTAAVALLPFGVWFSRYRPVSITRLSMLVVAPVLLLQGLANGFLTLFAARFLAVLFHSLTIAVRPLLFHQWAERRQYALINAVGLSLHSLLLAIAVSAGALLMVWLGSWRSAYYLQAAFVAAQAIAFVLVARESKAPAQDIDDALQSQPTNPLSALRKYKQGWLIAITMFSLASVWTGIVTFLPTLLQEDRGIEITLGGPLLGFLYYGLIPGALAGGWVNRKFSNRRVLLAVPALLNVLLALAIVLTTDTMLLALAITALGLVWIAVPALEMLPFEFDDIRPREVAAVSALIAMFAGLGFAAGPIIVGVVAELSGGLQTGLVVMALISGIGVIAGLLYPPSRGD